MALTKSEHAKILLSKYREGAQSVSGDSFSAVGDTTFQNAEVEAIRQRNNFTIDEANKKVSSIGEAEEKSWFNRGIIYIC